MPWSTQVCSHASSGVNICAVGLMPDGQGSHVCNAWYLVLKHVTCAARGCRSDLASWLKPSLSSTSPSSVQMPCESSRAMAGTGAGQKQAAAVGPCSSKGERLMKFLRRRANCTHACCLYLHLVQVPQHVAGKDMPRDKWGKVSSSRHLHAALLCYPAPTMRLCPDPFVACTAPPRELEAAQDVRQVRRVYQERPGRCSDV